MNRCAVNTPNWLGVMLYWCKFNRYLKNNSFIRGFVEYLLFLKSMSVLKQMYKHI